MEQPTDREMSSAHLFKQLPHRLHCRAGYLLGMSAMPPGEPTSNAPAPGLDVPGHELFGDSLKPHDGTVYHYTDATGLKGMLETGHVWASQASSLNDRSEAIDGWRRLHEMLISEDAHDLQSFTASRLKDAHKASARVFVVSASTEPNDVNQWRLYAADGWGYSLAIPAGRLTVQSATPEAPQLEDLAGLLKESPRFKEFYLTYYHPVLRPWIKVIYTDEQLRRVVRELIANVSAQEDSIREADDHAQDNLYMDLGQGIEDALATIAYLVKPAGFRGENEVRTVVTLPTFLEKEASRIEGYFPPLFRSGCNGIVGYFKLGWVGASEVSGDPIPWQEIICGPRHRHGDEVGSTVHEETIRMLIAVSGLDPIKVRTSDISLR